MADSVDKEVSELKSFDVPELPCKSVTVYGDRAEVKRLVTEKIKVGVYPNHKPINSNCDLADPTIKVLMNHKRGKAQMKRNRFRWG